MTLFPNYATMIDSDSESSINEQIQVKLMKVDELGKANNLTIVTESFKLMAQKFLKNKFSKKEYPLSY